METVCSSETLVNLYRTNRHHISHILRIISIYREIFRPPSKTTSCSEHLLALLQVIKKDTESFYNLRQNPKKEITYSATECSFLCRFVRKHLTTFVKRSLLVNEMERTSPEKLAYIWQFHFKHSPDDNKHHWSDAASTLPAYQSHYCFPSAFTYERFMFILIYHSYKIILFIKSPMTLHHYATSRNIAC
jgi:hypothetical protein